MLDWMHCGNSGLLAYLLAGVLVELVEECPYHGSRHVRCEQLWSDIATGYDQAGVTKARITLLEVSSFSEPGSHPCMKTKAIENRYLLQALIQVCKLHLTDCVHDLMRLKCLILINDAYTLVETADMFLTREQHTSLLEHVDNFLVCYNWLVKNALENGQLRFNFTPKFHMMWHIAYMSQYINPKCTWCFAFEDYMGLVVRSAIASMAATKMPRIGAKVVENMCLHLHVQLAQGHLLA